MSQDSILLNKSLLFAARIVKLYQYLSKEKHESVISKQIIRSGTSIGANANEAIYGVSKADFIAKLQISLKETAETEYWLRLLVLSDYLTETEGQSLIDDCLEIKRILISTLNTSKKNSQFILSKHRSSITQKTGSHHSAPCFIASPVFPENPLGWFSLRPLPVHPQKHPALLHANRPLLLGEGTENPQ